MHVSLWGYTYVSLGVRRSDKGVLDPRELESQAVMGHGVGGGK